MCEENLLTLGQDFFHFTRDFLITRLYDLKATYADSIRGCIIAGARAYPA
jgi:hypothetical protein